MTDATGPVILVADDSSTSRLMIKTRLTMNGYRIIEAGSGAETVRLAQTARPALLLCDYFLGDMTGAQVMTALKGDAAALPLPVIVISGNDAEEVTRACASLGASSFLLKPYESQDLLDQVQAALGGSRHRRKDA